MQIKVAREGNHDLPKPQRATNGAAAYDLQCVGEFRIRGDGDVVMIPTGWRWEIPFGQCGLILPRSGLALAHSITVANAPGLIDSDYRGEVRVVLINHGIGAVDFKHGDRIAQLMVVQHGWRFNLEEVPELSETRRGDGGFGSTGLGAQT